MKEVPTGPVNEFPWTEEHRIVQDFSAIHLPRDNQYQLENSRTIKKQISENGEPLGRLEIAIETDGIVEVIWKANYKEGEYEKDISGDFIGNVDSTMIYEDINGTDENKLFFIAKGNFILQAFKKNGRAMAGGGDAYVIGWIEPEGGANGTLVLVSDKKNTKIYKW